MLRLIFKCHHVKGDSKRSAAYLGNLVYYVAIREGVEQINSRKIMWAILPSVRTS